MAKMKTIIECFEKYRRDSWLVIQLSHLLMLRKFPLEASV